MINFIICEDNKNVRDLHEALISKITMPYDFDYTVHSFEKYNNKDATEEIRRLIKNELAKKHLLTYRLLNSFPNAKDKHHHKIIQLIKRQKN